MSELMKDLHAIDGCGEQNEQHEGVQDGEQRYRPSFTRTNSNWHDYISKSSDLLVVGLHTC